MRVCPARPIFLLVCLLLAASAAGAQDKAAPGTLNDAEGRVIPFLYDPPAIPLPIIQVSVNGKPALPFVIDTGTSVPLLINLWAATELGLTARATGGAGQDMSDRTVSLSGMVIQGDGHKNDFSFALNQASIIDVRSLTDIIIGPHVAGIVGIGVLASVTSRFDFVNKTLTVFDKPHPPLHIPGAAVLPLQMNPQGTVNVSVTLAPQQSVDLILDTGNTGTYLPLSAIPSVKPRASVTVGGVQMLSGFYLTPTLLLPHVMLGDLQEDDVVVGVLPPDTGCSLGLDLLTRFRLTLDLPHRQAILERPKGGSVPRLEDGWTGLTFASAGPAWFVKDIKPGSPALKTALQVGDTLIAVDGRPVAGLSLVQVNRLRDGLAGTIARLTMQRDAAKPFDVSFRRPDVFAASRSAVDGLVLKKPDGAPLLVLSVVPGCAAAQAGLRLGDEIVTLNALPTAALTINQLLNALATPTLQLTVQRAGIAKPLNLTLSEAAPQIKPPAP